MSIANPKLRIVPQKALKKDHSLQRSTKKPKYSRGRYFLECILSRRCGHAILSRTEEPFRNSRRRAPYRLRSSGL